MSKNINVARLLEKCVKEWELYYKLSGKPHPSSNDYLNLTRSFWLHKGVELAKKGIL